jgi:hypothetical protein
MKNILITILSLFLTCHAAKAQQNGIAVSFAYDNYFGENSGSGKLLGVRVSYEQMKELFGRSGSWRSGFQYSSGDYNVPYTASLNSTYNLPVLPNQIDILGVTSYKSIQFEFTQKMYFGNGNYQYGGLYFLFGFGLNVAKSEIIYDFPDNNNQYYSIDNRGDTKKSFFQPTLNIGAGYEYHLEYFNIFIESDLNTPIFSLTDINLDIDDFEFGDRGFNFYGLSLGVRINFP